METFDLIDFFLPRNNKISSNKIKESIEAILNDIIIRNRYKEIRVCTTVGQIIEPADLEKICQYCIV
ncbi:MAG: hypothetical protein ACJ71O_01595, partial [Nitrososphaeraceae archaeon]